MKRKSKIIKIIPALYCAVVLLFAALLVYIAAFEKADVFQARDTQRYYAVENFTKTEKEDPDAPLGVKTEYRWRLEPLKMGENCLAFYIVHHYAAVYFDGELVYQLKPQEGAAIGKSTSSNWVMIPLSPADSGRAVRVELTPVYRDVLNRKVDFFVGSQLAIYLQRLKIDLPPIILSVLCLLVGLFFIIMQLYYRLRHRIETLNLIHLGWFLIVIGLWKITDTRFSPFLFPQNPMVLGYITLAMLFIASVPFMLFIKGQIQNGKTRLLDIACLASILIAAAAAVLQIMGICDLRENIIWSHVTIALALFAVSVSIFRSWKRASTDRNTKISFLFFLFCAAGALVDLLAFYLNGSSSGVFYIIVSFLIYTAFLGIENIRAINRKAYTDAQTGLFNRGRCNEILSSGKAVESPIGFIMFDLNGLKDVNDTLGHAAGDLLIHSFGNILRNTIPASNFIGRYGGDEFIAIVQEDCGHRTQKILGDIAAAAATYNASGAEPKLSYAAGYALSEDHPGCSLQDILRKADENMYANKNAWYAENGKAAPR